MNSSPLSPAQAAEELLRRRRARGSLLDFNRYVMPDWQDGRHLELIASKLEDIHHGRCTRLILSVPPRHGKSQQAAINFPAWSLGLNPTQKFIVASYAADLAQRLSREAQRRIESEAYARLFPGTGLNPKNVRAMSGAPLRNVDQWEICDMRTGGPTGGGYKCTGVGGSLTGHGGDVLIVDDPFKNRAEANSPTVRQGVLDWYRSTLRTRLAPGGKIIVIQTRWHPGDLAGYLIDDSEGEEWEVINLPALDENGNALWPERWPREELLKIQAAVGRYEWEALYQGRPTVKGGNLLKIAGVQIHDSTEGWPEKRHSRTWDLASTAKQRHGDDPDWTCGALGCITRERDGATGAMLPHLWVRDAVFCREEAPKRDALIRATASRDGAGVSVYVEAFGGYKDAFTTLKQALGGVHMVRQLRLPGDKAVKAAPLEAIFEAGNVHLMRGPWNAEWLKQHEEFTGRDGATHDDAVDTSAMIYHIDAAPKASMAIPGMM
jgi:predicted phage terminase large subunit-like protein